MELHKIIDNLKRFKALMDKVNEYFYIYHIHANNFADEVYADNYNLPRVLEIGWIKKSLIHDNDVYFSNKILPLEIDAPNNKNKNDVDLSYWPFRFDDEDYDDYGN